MDYTSIGIPAIVVILSGFGFIWYNRITQATIKKQEATIKELETRVSGGEYLNKNKNNLFLQDMNFAFKELLKLNPKIIRVFSYVGNFAERNLWEGHKEIQRLDVRLLVRNPNSECYWKFPSNERVNIRKGEILRNIDRLHTDNTFSFLEHRISKSPKSCFVRYYPFEPPINFTIGEFEKDHFVGYVGFYPLQERRGGVDYSGTGKKVLRILSGTKEGQEILRDFVDWFDHYWEYVSIHPNDQEAKARG